MCVFWVYILLHVDVCFVSVCVFVMFCLIFNTVIALNRICLHILLFFLCSDMFLKKKKRICIIDGVAICFYTWSFRMLPEDRTSQ